ncbi:O-methyltransferase-domain-containing protein [Penicillium angulare]|uniref:O-methyltransferase-domain-containing protein n=1 Tax=Penicillium angulare TaxID=116970 RepID=A0A9W9KSD7_9EURO|nr:O-methyltransferase-domain-containing protein [Penicillium angulare]
MNSDILRLAKTISQSTQVLDQYAEANEPRMFSLDADAPARVPINSKEADSAKMIAISSCMELIDRLQGPMSCLQPLWNGTSLQAISRFNIASHVPLDREISYQDLSQACGLHASKLKQVIRFAIVHHELFREDRKGYVSHSSNSRVLAQDAATQAGVDHFDEFYGSFVHAVDAMEQYEGHEPSQTGFSLSKNTNESLFEYLGARPEKSKKFADAMKYHQSAVPECSPEFLASGYPWKSLPPGATVVDMGGSVGHVGRLIASTNPKIQVIVQDLPEVIENAEAKALQTNGTTNGHSGMPVKFQAHDFFHPQTLQADVYIFRWIMHDWPDHYVVRILKQLIPSLKAGAKVVLNESICPESRSLPLSVERYIRWMDIMMLSINNARLRDEEEWHDLFQEASHGFGPVRCWTPQGSALAIIEVEWQGDNLNVKSVI